MKTKSQKTAGTLECARQNASSFEITRGETKTTWRGKCLSHRRIRREKGGGPCHWVGERRAAVTVLRVRRVEETSSSKHQQQVNNHHDHNPSKKMELIRFSFYFLNNKLTGSISTVTQLPNIDLNCNLVNRLLASWGWLRLKNSVKLSVWSST